MQWTEKKTIFGRLQWQEEEPRQRFRRFISWMTAYWVTIDLLKNSKSIPIRLLTLEVLTFEQERKEYHRCRAESPPKTPQSPIPLHYVSRWIYVYADDLAPLEKKTKAPAHLLFMNLPGLWSLSAHTSAYIIYGTFLHKHYLIHPTQAYRFSTICSHGTTQQAGIVAFSSSSIKHISLKTLSKFSTVPKTWHGSNRSTPHQSAASAQRRRLRIRRDRAQEKRCFSGFTSNRSIDYADWQPTLCDRQRGSRCSLALKDFELVRQLESATGTNNIAGGRRVGGFFFLLPKSVRRDLFSLILTWEKKWQRHTAPWHQQNNMMMGQTSATPRVATLNLVLLFSLFPLNFFILEYVSNPAFKAEYSTYCILKT